MDLDKLLNRVKHLLLQTHEKFSGETCVDLVFLISCLRYISSAGNVLNTLQSGLQHIVTLMDENDEEDEKKEEFGTTPEFAIKILLAREHTFYAKDFKSLQADFQKIRKEDQEKRKKDLLAIILGLEHLQDIVEARGFLSDELLKYWYETKNAVHMTQLLERWWKSLDTHLPPTVSPTSFDTLVFNISQHLTEDSVKNMELLNVMILHSCLYYYPKVNEVPVEYNAKIVRVVNMWYEQLHPLRHHNQGMFIALLLSKACLGQLRIDDYYLLTQEWKPDVLPALQQQQQYGGNRVAEATSCILWLLLDAKMESLKTTRTSVRGHAMPKPDYSLELKYVEGEYEWARFGQVYVAPSQLSHTKDTGRGVFAKVDFQKGDVITEYCGQFKTSIVRTTPYMRSYIAGNPKVDAAVPDDDDDTKRRRKKKEDEYIDGESNITRLTSRQIGQIIQDPRRKKYVNSVNKTIEYAEIPEDVRAYGECVYAVTGPHKKRLLHHARSFDIADKDIKKGQEIYTDYGYDKEIYEKYHMFRKEPGTEKLAPPKPSDELGRLL